MSPEEEMKLREQRNELFGLVDELVIVFSDPEVKSSELLEWLSKNWVPRAKRAVATRGSIPPAPTES